LNTQDSGVRAHSRSKAVSQEPLKIGIVSASPVFARGLRDSWLLVNPDDQCTVATAAELADGAASTRPHVLFVAPLTWREFGRLLARLKSRFKSRPWLIFAELRVSGMLVTELRSAPVPSSGQTAPPKRSRRPCVSSSTRRPLPRSPPFTPAF